MLVCIRLVASLFFALKFLSETFAAYCAICVNLVYADSQHFEFFESKVRPILVNNCYECHSGLAEPERSGLRLDSRDAILKGGEHGPAIILGNPDESRMIRYVRHQGKKMPALGKPIRPTSAMILSSSSRRRDSPCLLYTSDAADE